MFGEDLKRRRNLQPTAAGSAGNLQRGAETEGGADEAAAPVEQRLLGESLRRWQSSAGACWRRRGHEETAPGRSCRSPPVWWLLPPPLSSSHSLLLHLLIASSSSPGPHSPPSSSRTPALLPSLSCQILLFLVFSHLMSGNLGWR